LSSTQAPRDLEARTSALYVSWLAGLSISTTGNAIHHKLCHVLGGFGLPHAETHSIVLPHAMAYNAAAAPEAMRRIARAIGAETAAFGLWDLEHHLGLPMKLADIGMKEADLERAARIAVQAPYPNPRPVEYDGVMNLLRAAYAGRRPD
jgi:maleylacetate reductase